MNTARTSNDSDGQASAYKVPRHPAPIDLRLDGNEGQVVCPDVLDVTSLWTNEDLRQYPSTEALETAIAAQFNIQPAQVLVTAGADDGLLRMCRTYLSPDRDLLLPVPTFEMIERFADWCFATTKTIPWDGGAYPVDQVLARVDDRTGLVAVVSPNNPTGGVISSNELKRLSMACTTCMLMVDGAYAEFADEDLTSTALSLPNAVVFRTVSKALGLAGLRVGFAMGSVDAIQRLRAMGMPYPVSAPSLRLAQAGLARRAKSEPYIETVRRERGDLLALLSELGMETYPSQGNFVFARTENAQWWRDALAGLGIGIRAWPGKPGLENALRITCPGNEQEFKRLTEALRTVAAPEAILFDIDGVLADVSTSYRGAIIETAKTFGAVVTAEDIETCKQAGDANNDWVVTQRLLSQQGIQQSLDTVKNTFESVYWGTSTCPGLYTNEQFIGDPDALVALGQRVPIAAVTGRPRRDALHVLERFGILNCFSAIVTMDDAPAKPSPEPVRQALKLLDVQRAWMLGDTRDDVDAARGAGVLPIGVLAPGAQNNSQTRDHLLESGAARVFGTWMELETNI